MNSNNDKYLILTKLFDITKPYSLDIIDLILKNNNGELKFRIKKTKEELSSLPTLNDKYHEFELILTNSNNKFASIVFFGNGMEGQISIYTIETSLPVIFRILSQFYLNQLEITNSESTVYIK